jgi:hypothetical protein
MWRILLIKSKGGFPRIFLIDADSFNYQWRKDFCNYLREIFSGLDIQTRKSHNQKNYGFLQLYRSGVF